jgi:predicted site-specific integrase-resolvase
MEIYNLQDLSKKLNITIIVLRRYIKSGMLKASKIGRSYIVQETDLKEFLDNYKDKRTKY